MDATELRIGNLLQGSSGPLRVTRIFDADRIGIGSGDPYKVSGENPCLAPIPITQEWLFKFGFKKLGNLYNRVILGDKKFGATHIMQQQGDHNEWAFFGNDYYITHNCQFVHQLQNIVFALSGKELEYNG